MISYFIAFLVWLGVATDSNLNNMSNAEISNMAQSNQAHLDTYDNSTGNNQGVRVFWDETEDND